MSDSEHERFESPVESPAASLVASGDDNNSDAGNAGPADDASAIASGDDLFGDGGDDDAQSEILSEHSLGPEDDDQRYGDDDDDGGHARQVTKEELVMDVDIFRHRVPKPTSGKIQSLRVPNFVRICPEEYRASTYEPTAAEVKDSLSSNPQSVARFRRDKSGALQSNAAFYRWSDGSVTMAIGDEHFEVLTKSLAPASAVGPDAGMDDGNKPYQELQDAHYYAAAAHLSSSLLLTVGHVAEQYTVRANRMVADDALQRLTDRLHAASQTSLGGGTNMIIRTMRDPELAKKEAELAEKERERARRRRENASARLEGGFGGGSGRSGRSGGALSINDLEGGGRRSGGGRKRGPGAGSGAKRRRPEYDSDDELPQGARRSDEYDKGDDFIAPSDDEDEDGGGDDDEDEEEDILEDDEDEDDRGASRRHKRQRTVDSEDADADDDVPARDAARRGRRTILDDDEE